MGQRQMMVEEIPISTGNVADIWAEGKKAPARAEHTIDLTEYLTEGCLVR